MRLVLLLAFWTFQSVIISIPADTRSYAPILVNSAVSAGMPTLLLEAPTQIKPNREAAKEIQGRGYAGLAYSQTHERGIVNVILFWMEGCSHCHYVLEEVLPPLQQQYKDQLSVLLIELKSAEDVDRLYQTAATFGMDKKEVGVPFLIIGDTVLTGSSQIPAELPGLIEHYLDAGGVDYPALPSLAGVLPTADPLAQIDGEVSCNPSTTCSETQSNPIETIIPSTIAPSTEAEITPVVHLLLYWTPDCNACKMIIDETLPLLLDRYDKQLVIQNIDVVSGADVDAFYQVAAAFGVSKDDANLPMIIIGNHALIGSEQIPDELPGLIEKFLAEGGVASPEIPGPGENTLSLAPTNEEPSNGFWLAYVVIIFMVASLLFAGIAFVRGTVALPRLFSLRWIDLAIPVLCLIGLGVAGYLAYVETQAVSAVCGPVGDCNAVQSSPYARLFGILPIGVLGLAGYLAILAAWLYHRFQRSRMSSYMPVIIFGFTTFGVLFSLYLTVLEPFVIHAVCIWCITSAVIMTLLLLLSIQPALQAMKNLQEADHPHANDEIETTSP